VMIPMLTDEQEVVVDLVREFVAREVVPVSAQLDRNERPEDCFSWELIEKASEAGFQEVEELAVRLCAAVGASRAAVDAGWARTDQQVGLTGHTVAPRVYLAIGISGASQHLAGMSRSDVVLAVNSDRAAPMVGASDVAFVADWHTLWPALERLLPSRKGEAALPSPR